MNPEIQHFLEIVRSYSLDCEKGFEMHADALRELLNEAVEDIKALTEPRTLIIETEGGVISNVHGMRPGDTYDIADWDETNEEAGPTQATLTQMIRDAQAQNIS